MRKIALTIQHSSLILILVWGLFICMTAAATRLAERWHSPGVIVLMMLVALDAIATQRIVMRDRQRLEEQLGVRGIEFLIIVILVRIFSLAAQDGPLLTTIQPWLREPLEFFSGRFGEYFLWTLIAWVVTTLLAIDVIEWANDINIDALPETSIEREQLQTEWGLSVSRFRRRYLAIMVITLATATFALYDSESLPTAKPSSTLLIIAALGALIAGLLLHSAGRLHQLRRNWRVDNIEIDAGVSRRWGRFGLLLILLLLLIAPLVGWAVLVAPPPPLVPIINALLVVMTLAVTLVILLLGVLLSPLIFLLSLLSGRGQSSVPSVPQIVPPQIAQPPSERPLLPALIFWGCVTVLVVVALVRYLQGRSDLREALARWRVLRWLGRLFGEWWHDASGWITLATDALRRAVQRRRQPPRSQRLRGPQAQLRELFRRMQVAGARRGAFRRLSQTPYEYDAELSGLVEGARADVHGLTETYVVAEYGPRRAGPTEIQRARKHWTRLQRWLRHDESAFVRLRARNRRNGSEVGD